jgi:hypothetical protein
MNGETSVADYKNHNPKRELASNGFGKCNVRGKQKRSNHNFKGPATERKQRSAETPTFAQLPTPTPRDWNDEQPAEPEVDQPAKCGTRGSRGK